MGKVIVLSLIVLFELLSEMLKAQDIHFSQIHASPVMLNPAFTGMFNGDFRFIGNYRNQWKNVTADYNTAAASVDGKLFSLGNYGMLNCGLNFNTDRAGDLSYTKTEAKAAVSVIKALNRFGTNFVSVGMEFGHVSRSADYSKIYFTESSTDPLLAQSSASNQFDLSAGLSWYFLKKDRFLVYTGASMYHINKPVISFTGGADKEYLYERYILNVGAEIRLNHRVWLLPSAMSFFQGPYREENIGGYIRHKLSSRNENEKTYFYYGVWTRWYVGNYSAVDAMNMCLRLDYKGFCYGFSYDFNVSNLAKASRYQGGAEVSVIYIIDTGFKGFGGRSGNKFRSKKYLCPDF